MAMLSTTHNSAKRIAPAAYAQSPAKAFHLYPAPRTFITNFVSNRQFRTKLEIAVTHRKQTLRASSNRHFWDVSENLRRLASAQKRAPIQERLAPPCVDRLSRLPYNEICAAPHARLFRIRVNRGKINFSPLAPLGRTRKNV
jgi:hypothetical protein